MSTPEGEVVEETTETTALVPPGNGPAARGPLVLTTPAVLQERLDTYSACRKILLLPETDLEAALVRGEFLPLRQPVGPVGGDGGATGESPELHVREALCDD